jgi:hypothetical protein
MVEFFDEVQAAEKAMERLSIEDNKLKLENCKTRKDKKST